MTTLRKVGIASAIVVALFCGGVTIAALTSADEPSPGPTTPATATPSPQQVTPTPEATTETAPETTTEAPEYYANCDEARAAGVTPLHTGDPGYRSELDRDGDGVACE